MTFEQDPFERKVDSVEAEEVRQELDGLIEKIKAMSPEEMFVMTHEITSRVEELEKGKVVAFPDQSPKRKIS